MSSPTVDEVIHLFSQMEHADAGQPGTLRRRLRAELRHLRIHVEVDLPEKTRALVVASAEGIGDQHLLETAGLQCRSHNGTVRLQADPSVEVALFCTLVADLVHYVGTVETRPAAALVQRIRSWQKMLAAGLSVGLSPQAQMGLFGELLVLREVLLPAWGPVAVQAWAGPTRAPQDFRHGDIAVEVKCVSSRDSERCRISNEYQLDDTELDFLCLVHQAVRTDPEGGVSLPELVDSIRADPRLADHQVLLEERLLHAGWLDLHRSQYARERYSLTARRCYDVGHGFPRLTPRDVPDGVRSVSYSLDLDRCVGYLLTEHELGRRLRQQPPLEEPHDR